MKCNEMSCNEIGRNEIEVVTFSISGGLPGGTIRL